MDIRTCYTKLKKNSADLRREFDVSFVSKPNNESKVEIAVTVLAIIIYAVGGIILLYKNENNMLDVISNSILAAVLLFISLLFICLLVYRLDKNSKSHYATNEISRIGKISFIALIPGILIYKRIKRTIKGVRQDEVVLYFPIIFLVIPLSLLLFSKIEIPFIQRVLSYLGIMEYISQEFSALLIAFLFNSTFFILTDAFVYGYIYLTERIITKNGFSIDIVKNEFGTVKTQLAISKVLYYLLVALVCLSVHCQNENEKALVNAFLGLTTLAALTREIEFVGHGRKGENEECKENIND